MPHYRVVAGSITRFEPEEGKGPPRHVLYSSLSNSLIEMSADEAKRYGRRLRLVNDPSFVKAAAAPAAAPPPNDDDPNRPDPAVVAEYKTALFNATQSDALDTVAEMDDVATVRAIIEAERQGRNRKRVIKAAEARRLVLESEHLDLDDADVIDDGLGDVDASGEPTER